ncbi:DNA primase [Streptomyces sp. S.PNR 29]|uniref:DNA primase n=1 Tax=Streptomyces sp. S.PNR 29 TaxID=2973805 RepID=UPI0025AF24C2|nr:DNA primase [Streptomyces sp. S.PNR 29]MDN0198400.1 DNA primase [Streptomyces sp. S.PNR 29]
MNRVGLGLAVGAGYVLGRTKKMKLAMAVGSLAAGKRMHLSPRALADVVNQQLKNNPQLKEIGEELRQDLRGVGKAASGAMVERQIDALADRLHGRTAQVRDQLTGVTSKASGLGSEESEKAEDTEGSADEEAREERPDEAEEEPEPGEEPGPRGKAAKKAPPKPRQAMKKAPAKKAAAKKTPGKKAAAKKTGAAKKTAGKKTASAGGARPRLPKGGGER